MYLLRFGHATLFVWFFVARKLFIYYWENVFQYFSDNLQCSVRSLNKMQRHEIFFRKATNFHCLLRFSFIMMIYRLRQIARRLGARNGCVIKKYPLKRRQVVGDIYLYLYLLTARQINISVYKKQIGSLAQVFTAFRKKN